MTVSIIIPVYNVAPYIQRCIKSVCAQTYKKFECILVDDCGTDESINIAKCYIEKYQGDICFKIIQHTKNQGLSAARNTGINAATGEYLYFLDSDDAIPNDCIETLMSLANKYPDADFVQGNILAENGDISKYGVHFDVPEYCNNKSTLEHLILNKIITNACNRIIRRSFIINHSLFFPLGLLHEDLYWVFFMAKYVNAAAFTKKGTYIYYINNNSIVTSVSDSMYIKRYDSRLKIAKAILDDIKQTGYANKYRRHYIAGDLIAAMVELSALHSIRHWLKFWKFICNIAVRQKTRITWYRFLLFAAMMPPLCFFISFKSYHWRLQHHVVSKI